MAIRDERDYAAALDELDDLKLSESGAPPGRRFDELVLLIEDYEARRNGYLRLRRGTRTAASPSPVFDHEGNAPGRREYTARAADPAARAPQRARPDA